MRIRRNSNPQIERPKVEQRSEDKANVHGPKGKKRSGARTTSRFETAALREPVKRTVTEDRLVKAGDALALVPADEKKFFKVSLKKIAQTGSAQVSGKLSKLASAVESARASLEGHVEKGRAGTALAGVDGVLGKISKHAFAANLQSHKAVSAGTLAKYEKRVQGARGELNEIRDLAGTAGEALGESPELSGNEAVRAAVGQLGEVGEWANQADAQLGTGLGQAAVLAEEGPATTLTQEELEKLGTGLQPPGGPQLLWTGSNPAVVGTITDKAKQQGLLTDEKLNANYNLANAAIAGETTQPLSAEQFIAAAKESGIPLEKLDPQQALQASRYINEATTPKDQRDRMAWSLSNLQLAADNKLPNLTRKDQTELLWAAGNIPGHALQKLSDSELSAKYQELARATNTPGETKLKVGSHNVTLKVSADGQVLKSETKKPSFLSKLGAVAKIGLKIGSFIPGPIGVGCRVASAVIGVVEGIKKGSLFQAVTGALSAVGAGAASLGMKSLASVANGARSVLSGVKGVADAIKNKSLTAGLGAIASVAGGLAGIAGKGAENLTGFAKNMQNLSRFTTGAQSAATAISQAKQGNYLGALTSGVSGLAGMAGATGKTGLEAQLKNISGYASAAESAYTGVKTGNYLAAAEGLASFASSKVDDPALKQHLLDTSKVLGGAGDLQQAIKTKDWLAAAAAGTDIASGLVKSGSNTRADLEGATKVLNGSKNLRDAVATGNLEMIADAGKALFDTTKAEIKGHQERNVVLLPVKTIDPSKLVVPGMAGEPDTMKLAPFSADGDTMKLPPVRDLGPLGAPFSADGETMKLPPIRDLGPLAPTTPAGIPFDPKVQSAQIALKAWAVKQGMSMDIAVDGKLGRQTEAALKVFQGWPDISLPPTGKLDPATERKLLEVSAGTNQAAVPGFDVPVPPGTSKETWDKQVADASKWAAKLQKLYIDVAGEGESGTTLTKLYGIQDAIKGVQSAFAGDATKASMYLARVAGGGLKVYADVASSKYAKVVEGLEQTPVTEKFAKDFLAGFDKLKGLGRVLNAPLNTLQFLDSAKKALTGSDLSGKSIYSGVPLLDIATQANAIRGAISQGKFLLPEIGKALDFALGGIPGDVKAKLSAKLSATLVKALEGQSAEKVTLFLQKLSQSRLGPVIDKCITKGGSIAGELAPAISRWAGPIGIGFDVTKTFLELMAPEINAARQGLNIGINRQADGGSVEGWLRQVSSQTVDPTDAHATFQTNKFFRDQFLSGSSGYAAGGGKAAFEALVKSQPDVYRLYKENWKVHDSATEAWLATRLKELATEFLRQKAAQLKAS